MSLGKQHAEKYFRFENSGDAKSIVDNKHYHTAFEIYYLEDGLCRYFIDNKCYDVSAGDIVLIPEGVIHHTTYQGEYHRRRLIYCSRSFIPNAVTEKLSSMTYIYRNSSVSEDVKKIFNIIEREYSSPDRYSSGIISTQTELLFYLLARNKNEYPSSSEGNEYVSAAIGYVREHLTDGVKLSDAARAVSVSPEHLSRIFKQNTGLGFSEYVTLLRLRKAEELLRGNGRMSVSEVAYACGFNDSNYFSEKFKRSYGLSPIKYRKQQTE